MFLLCCKEFVSPYGVDLFAILKHRGGVCRWHSDQENNNAMQAMLSNSGDAESELNRSALLMMLTWTAASYRWPQWAGSCSK